LLYEPASDPTPHLGMDCGVEDEPDQAPPPVGADIDQTAFQYGIPIPWFVPAPRRREQPVKLLGGDCWIDTIELSSLRFSFDSPRLAPSREDLTLGEKEALVCCEGVPVGHPRHEVSSLGYRVGIAGRPLPRVL
jgi:hypothetical protein